MNGDRKCCDICVEGEKLSSVGLEDKEIMLKMCNEYRRTTAKYRELSKNLPRQSG